jgi:outer membrane protein assembly factor BamE (lipoprotein component of BamABCDE complex)
MHALLLAAALAVGSGDARDRATDGRTVDEPAPLLLLKEGMTKGQVDRIMGYRSLQRKGNLGSPYSEWYYLQRTYPGIECVVRIWFDKAGRLVKWTDDRQVPR